MTRGVRLIASAMSLLTSVSMVDHLVIEARSGLAFLTSCVGLDTGSGERRGIVQDDFHDSQSCICIVELLVLSIADPIGVHATCAANTLSRAFSEKAHALASAADR
jgi:hypothetical protein